MNQLEVEVFSEAVNCPVLRFPGRKFPGLLIQGDTLKNLVDTVGELSTLDANSEEFRDELAAITEQLTTMLDHYEKVLNDHKISAPYTRNTSQPKWGTA